MLPKTSNAHCGEVVPLNNENRKALQSSLHCAGGICLPPPHGDQIRFGLQMSPHAGCCLDNLKTGKMDGCCSDVSTEKHLEKFRHAVEAERLKTGKMPELDAHTQAILAGQVKPGESFHPVKVTPPRPLTEAALKAKAAADARLREPFILRLIYAPFRFLKWFFIGFWKDMKQLISREKVD